MSVRRSTVSTVRKAGSVRKAATVGTAAVAALTTAWGLAAPAAAAATARTAAVSAAGDSEPAFLATAMSGHNEVPVQGGAAAGDPDGRATALLELRGDRLTYTLTWENIGAPTAAHLHVGAAGVNGPVAVMLFAGRPDGSARSAKGTVRVTDPAVLDGLRTDPTGFYVNLHTAKYPGGAVRGRLHALSQFKTAPGRVFVRQVVRGAQVYQCAAQADGGSFAYRQYGVEAVLRGRIRHSFVQPVDGPPQWAAPDGSRVTGKVVSRAPNGTGNIPELDLAATQAGAAHGLLARTGEILRLNTTGGVAPSGTCDPQARPLVRVPYEADYLFIG